MIVCIRGKRFDTDRAQKHWDLYYHDGSNGHTGDVFLSSKGTWYVYTMSQWGNGHRWELMSPEEILERLGHGLEEEEKKEIIQLAELETE